jgi:type IV pilus assembly protein PilN
MLVASSALAVVLALMLGFVVFLILADRARMKDTRVAVARLDSEVRKISAEQARLEGTLRQSANAEVLQRSYLLNQLIEKKSISWTKIFNDLEGVMPADVRIISVRLPQVNSQNEVMLDVQVGAKEPGPFLVFLNRLNKSPLFGPVDPKSTQPPTQQEPLFRYRFTVNYAQKL